MQEKPKHCTFFMSSWGLRCMVARQSGQVSGRLRLIISCRRWTALARVGGETLGCLSCERGGTHVFPLFSSSAALSTGRCLSWAGWPSLPYVWPRSCSTLYLCGTSCWRGVRLGLFVLFCISSTVTWQIYSDSKKWANFVTGGATLSSKIWQRGWSSSSDLGKYNVPWHM